MIEFSINSGMRHKKIDIETEYKLVDAAKAGDQSAIDTLVLGNSGLIIKYLKKFKCANNFTPDDAYQCGVIGLIEAIRTFDTSKGVRFCTHATPWIKALIYRSSIYDSGTLKLPANYNDLIKDGSILDIHVDSLDDVINADGDTYTDLLIDENAYFIADIEQLELEKEIRKAIRELEIELRQVIIMQMYRGLKYHEIAQKLGISTATVQDRLHDARAKLKSNIKR
jgi:RNA polymerase sigma factor (sigma-70 family)